ncbi:MAG: serine/threonine protein kinase [Myxococcota bacterium]|nr:serine/threonine protein kinase [Myxococcota bacterium]MDW8362708.1 serine/threonine-protein kinase [Myxococcales bacterium]
MSGGGVDWIGRRVGAYVIEARIGGGAMGTVFRASAPGRATPVALKVLHEAMGSVAALRRRFEREARALARLVHPRIVAIEDFGVDGDLAFLAMELLQGRTLEAELARGPVAPQRALSIACDVLEGLAYAHALQIVHRDLKPANVFLERRPDGDFVKLLDFGLVKFLSIEEVSEEGTLTRKGRIVGTPAYMSPEQITGVSLDVRADLYAVGVILYEMLADRRPFDYERRSELLRAHLCEPVPPLHVVRPSLRVVPELVDVLDRALRKDPADRWPSAASMCEALRALPSPAAWVEGEPAPRHRVRSAARSSVLSAEELREAAALASRGGGGAGAVGAAVAPGSSPGSMLAERPALAPTVVGADDSSAESVPMGTIPSALRAQRVWPHSPGSRRFLSRARGWLWTAALSLWLVAAVLWLLWRG